jgi:hypothetical protein
VVCAVFKHKQDRSNFALLNLRNLDEANNKYKTQKQETQQTLRKGNVTVLLGRDDRNPT